MLFKMLQIDIAHATPVWRMEVQFRGFLQHLHLLTEFTGISGGNHLGIFKQEMAQETI